MEIATPMQSPSDEAKKQLGNGSGGHLGAAGRGEESYMVSSDAEYEGSCRDSGVEGGVGAGWGGLAGE